MRSCTRANVSGLGSAGSLRPLQIRHRRTVHSGYEPREVRAVVAEFVIAVRVAAGAVDVAIAD